MRAIGFGFATFLSLGVFVPNTAIAREHPPSAKDLLRDARLADVRAVGHRSFQLEAKISLQQANAMKTEGSYRLSWVSPSQWREEFSFPDFNQVRVSAPGGVWETRKPAYLSLNLWQLMQALTSYGRLELQREETANKIKTKKKNGTSSRCIEVTRDGFPIRELCFSDDAAHLTSEHYLPSDRTYEFTDYRPVGTEFFPGIIDVYDGKALSAQFSVSKLEEKGIDHDFLLEKPTQAEWRPWCASPETGGDPLTPIFSRMVRSKGEATIYGALGTDGQWHNVHVLESGGTAHDTDVLEALKKERWKQTTCGGVPIVIETVFKR